MLSGKDGMEINICHLKIIIWDFRQEKITLAQREIQTALTVRNMQDFLDSGIGSRTVVLRGTIGQKMETDLKNVPLSNLASAKKSILWNSPPYTIACPTPARVHCRKLSHQRDMIKYIIILNILFMQCSNWLHFPYC